MINKLINNENVMMENCKVNYECTQAFSILERALIFEIIQIKDRIKNNKYENINLEEILKNIKKRINKNNLKMTDNEYDDNILNLSDLNNYETDDDDDDDDTESEEYENETSKTSNKNKSNIDSNDKARRKYNNSADKKTKKNTRQNNAEKKQTFESKLKDICSRRGINNSILNEALKKIDKLRSSKIKNFNVNEFSDNLIKAIKDIARGQYTGRQADSVHLARYFVTNIIEKTEIIHQEKTARKRKLENTSETPPAKHRNEQPNTRLYEQPTNDQNNITDNNQSIRENVPIVTQKSNSIIPNMSISNEIGTIITAEGKNLMSFHLDDEILMREKLQNELNNNGILKYKHVSIIKNSQTRMELRIITIDKETADKIIAKQHEIFGGISIISCQTTANRLLMKCQVHKNNKFNEMDIKEMEVLRKKYGVLNIEAIQTNQRNKKFKIEFCTSTQYFEAYLNGIFLGNDRVACTPCWKLIQFCMKCSTWEHEINNCTSTKFTCFYCGEDHDGYKCETPSVTNCRQCHGQHESFSNKCDTFKIKFKEINKYIFDLLESEKNKVDCGLEMNINIPKNSHIIYQIKNPNSNKSLTISGIPKEITTRLENLEEFEKRQIKANDSLSDRITKEVSSITSEVLTLKGLMENQQQSQLNFMAQQQQNRFEDIQLRNALISKLGLDLQTLNAQPIQTTPIQTSLLHTASQHGTNTLNYNNMSNNQNNNIANQQQMHQYQQYQRMLQTNTPLSSNQNEVVMSTTQTSTASTIGFNN